MKTTLLAIAALMTIAAGCTAQPLNRWSVRAGELRIADTGLSRQQYSGPTVGVRAEHIDTFRHRSRVAWQMREQVAYAPLVNASHSARMHWAALTLDFATHYLIPLPAGFTLAAGGRVEAAGAIKYQTRNVNNISTGDIRLALDAVLSAHYQSPRLGRHGNFAIAAGYQLATPVVGMFFAPDYGQSYYELYMGLPESAGRALRFSSFHNFQAIRGEVVVDLIFPHGALWLGFGHEHNWWHAAGIRYYQHSLTGSVGFALRLAALRPY